MEQALWNTFAISMRVMWWILVQLFQLLGIGMGAMRNRMAKGGPYNPPRLVTQPEDEQQVLKSAKQSTPFPMWLMVVMGLLGCGVFAALDANTLGCILGLVVFIGGIAGFVYLTNPREAPLTPGATALDLATTPIYRLRINKDSEFNPQAALTLLTQLFEVYGSLAFQIVAEKGRISWQIIDWDTPLDAEIMRQSLRRLYPELEIDEVERTTPLLPTHRVSLYYTHGLMYPAPILEVEDINGYDPLVVITQAISELGEGERVSYTLAVTGPAYGAGKVGEQQVTMSNVHPIEYTNIWTAAGAEVRRAKSADRAPAFVERLQRVLTAKLNSRLHHALLSVDIEAPDPERAATLALAIFPAIQFEKPEFNGLVPADNVGHALQAQRIDSEAEYHHTSALGRLVRWATTNEPGWAERLLVLSETELAALWHLPHQEFTSDIIDYVKGRQVAVPRIVAEEGSGIIMGVGRSSGREVAVRLTPFARTSHMITVGRTRYGKSTFLHNLIHQDIANGSGVGVLDPHGDLVHDILSRSIPPEREDDVVIWDLSDRAYPPPLNFFNLPQGVVDEAVTELISGVFEHAYTELKGSRMADTLYGVLATLVADREATPRDAVRLFSDQEYRRALLAKDPYGEVADFWKEWDRRTEHDKSNRADPITWRLRALFRSELLRPVFCNPVAFDLKRFIGSGKIILVSLKQPEGMTLTEENQTMLGAMWVALFQLHAMSSGNAKPFYLYIDEAQNFTTSALERVLNEAAKRKLYLTLSHQTLTQLDSEALRAAVLGNVGAMAVFSVGERDAPVLSKYMSPSFSANDLMNLPPYTVAARVKHPSEQPPAFTLKTRPQPGQEGGAEWEQHLRECSREALRLKSREEVEVWYKGRYAAQAQAIADMDDEDRGDPTDTTGNGPQA